MGPRAFLALWGSKLPWWICFVSLFVFGSNGRVSMQVREKNMLGSWFTSYLHDETNLLIGMK